MSLTTDDVLHRLFSLDGKVVLITGAAGGIGRILTQGMADAGATVALCDIDLVRMQPIAEGILAKGKSAEAFAVDLASRSSITSLVEAVHRRWGHIDILVNCAAINKREPILEVTEEIFEKIINVNLRGLYQLTQTVATGMIQQGGGKIINFSSITPELALYGVSVYGATKAAVSQLTMSMAVEWAKHNIQVNAIAPGFIKTELTVPLWQDEQKAAWMRGRIALGRPADPDELLGMAILLASAASSYITGVTYCVDGGITAGGGHW